MSSTATHHLNDRQAEPDQMPDPSQPVHITCLCGKVQEVLSTSLRLPVETNACHCNSCRHISGTLYHSTFNLNTRPDSVDRCEQYDSSPTTTRYFCGKCGTHLFKHTSQEDVWYASLGAVDRISEHEQVFSGRLETIVEHQFVADTLDGGLLHCLPIGDQGFASHVLQGTQQSFALTLSSSYLAASEERSTLHAQCHCGGVEFYVTRPNEESIQCSSPWPDLIRPYHSQNPANPSDEKWWIRGRTFLAGTCACRTCRLSFGSPIVCWAFIPRVNVFHKDGSPWSFRSDILRSYESSKGKWREFCGRCGASVFWHCEERPGVLDISVGILRAEEGARATRWLTWWTDRVSFSEDALDKHLIAKVEARLKMLNT